MSTEPSPRPGGIAPAKLAHIVLRTPRYDEMVEWYRSVLCAPVVFANAFITFLTYDDEHHRIALLNMPQLGDADPLTPGLDHVAFTYASFEDLVLTYERLKTEGRHPHWCINHGPTTSLYYRDPDGNQVELQIDNFEKEADLEAWFATGAFQANPIGVEFDPDLLAAKFHAGEPVSELVRQGAAGRA